MVASSAIRRDNPELVGSAAAENSRHSARRDAGRIDAPEIWHRGGRRARQDHHHLHGRLDPGRGRPGPHLRRGRARQSRRHHGAPRPRRIHGGRSGRERPLVPAAGAGRRRGDHHRSRTPRPLRLARGDSGRFHAIRESRTVLRRGGALPRRAQRAGHHPARHPPGDHLRHLQPGRSGHQRRRPARPGQRVPAYLSRRGSGHVSPARPARHSQRAQCRRCRCRGALSRCSRRPDSRRPGNFHRRGPALRGQGHRCAALP